MHLVLPREQHGRVERLLAVTLRLAEGALDSSLHSE